MHRKWKGEVDKVLNFNCEEKYGFYTVIIKNFIVIELMHAWSVKMSW